MEEIFNQLFFGLIGGAIAGFSGAAKNTGQGEPFEAAKFIPAVAWGAFFGLISGGTGLGMNELETSGFSFVTYTFFNNVYKGIGGWLQRKE